MSQARTNRLQSSQRTSRSPHERTCQYPPPSFYYCYYFFFFFLHLGRKVVAIRLENTSHHMISCVIPVHQMTSGVEEIHSEEQGEGRINQIFTMRNITEPCSERQRRKNTSLTSRTLLTALTVIRKILRSFGIPSHIVNIMCTA